MPPAPAAAHAAIWPGVAGSEARTIGITGRNPARNKSPPISRRWGPLMRIKTVAAWRCAQHPATAGIGVVPDDASVRRHPFQVIVRVTLGTIGRTFGIVEIAGMGAADAGQKAIQRLHAVAGVAIVRRRGP